MFVRFRTTRRRLQASLIETRRVAGKVHHEHVASLGSVDVELSVADRVAFWLQLHPRLDRLANRLDAEASARVLAAMHERIPMVSIDEQRALQLQNAEADERLWRDLADIQTERAEGNGKLAAGAERTAIEAKQQAENATTKAEEAKDRVDRLKRGEVVTGGLGKPVDIEQIFRDAGWTAADFKAARQSTAIAKLGGEAGSEELLDEIGKRHKSAERAARRAVLRRLVVQGLREGRITRE